jgi:polygalacturonase
VNKLDYLIVGALLLSLMRGIVPAQAPALTAPTNLAISGVGVVNMRTAGARGDGVANDSKAIQAAINAAPNGAKLYFPAGIYRLNSITVEGRSGLVFEGDGPATILQWSGVGLPDSYTAMMTFTNVDGLTFQNLWLDNRAINRFGGVRLYSVKNVLIQRTRFYDSNRQLPITDDRYAFVFGQGKTPSENINVIDNVFDDLELEIDHARRVRVSNNTLTRGTWLAFNWSSHSTNSVAEDYELTNNTFIDPNGYAITFHSESKGPHLVRNIRISNNKILMPSLKRFGINVGNSQNQIDTGTIWKNIIIENNHIEYGRGYTITAPFVAIQTARNLVDGFMQEIVIRHNTIIGNGALQNWAVKANALENSSITGNVITGVLNGLEAKSLKDTGVSDNNIQASGTALIVEHIQ